MKNKYLIPVAQFCLEKNKASDFLVKNTIFHKINKQKYYMYLISLEWKKKRDFIIKRDSICRLCEKSKSEQVHHITYDRIYNEKESDLVGLCSYCHRAIHNKNVFSDEFDTYDEMVSYEINRLNEKD